MDQLIKMDCAMKYRSDEQTVPCVAVTPRRLTLH